MYYYRENWTDNETRVERDTENREKTTPKKKQDYHDFVGYYDYEE